MRRSGGGTGRGVEGMVRALAAVILLLAACAPATSAGPTVTPQPTAEATATPTATTLPSPSPSWAESLGPFELPASTFVGIGMACKESPLMPGGARRVLCSNASRTVNIELMAAEGSDGLLLASETIALTFSSCAGGPAVMCTPGPIPADVAAVYEQFRLDADRVTEQQAGDWYSAQLAADSNQAADASTLIATASQVVELTFQRTSSGVYFMTVRVPAG